MTYRIDARAWTRFTRRCCYRHHAACLYLYNDVYPGFLGYHIDYPHLVYYHAVPSHYAYTGSWTVNVNCRHRLPGRTRTRVRLAAGWL